MLAEAICGAVASLKTFLFKNNFALIHVMNKNDQRGGEGN